MISKMTEQSFASFDSDMALVVGCLCKFTIYEVVKLLKREQSEDGDIAACDDDGLSRNRRKHLPDIPLRLS